MSRLVPVHRQERSLTIDLPHRQLRSRRPRKRGNAPGVPTEGASINGEPVLFMQGILPNLLSNSFSEKPRNAEVEIRDTTNDENIPFRSDYRDRYPRICHS